MLSVTSQQNEKMEEQVLILSEKLEFFIEQIRKQQGVIKRGEYFTLKEDEFKGKC